MTVVLFNDEMDNLIIISFQNGKGEVTEDCFGGYEYAPVQFEYDNRGMGEDEDDPLYDWAHGAISLHGEDGTDLTGFEEADYGVIFDKLGSEKADYFNIVYNS